MLNLFQTSQDFHISINGLLIVGPKRPHKIIGGSKVTAKKGSVSKKKIVLILFWGVRHQKDPWFNVHIVLSRQH